MKTILLAAGYATRLYPLTKNQPKPLLQVGNQTILDHILNKLSKLPSIDKIYVVTNQKFYDHFQKWHQNHPLQQYIEILNDQSTCEEDRLGAIGDIHFTLQQKQIQDDLLIVAGDNLFELSLPHMLQFAKEKNTPVLCAKNLQHKKHLLHKYGIVQLDENQKIIHFEEKPSQPKSHFVATALYYFPQHYLHLFQQYIQEGNLQDAPGYFIQWLYQKQPLYAYTFQEDWFDIGDLASLKEAQQYYTK